MTPLDALRLVLDALGVGTCIGLALLALAETRG